MSINVLQISVFSLPKYITEYNKQNLDGKYVFYSEKESSWLNYFETNNNETNYLTVFKKIKSLVLQKCYFILFYLFVNGGFYINENVIIESAINQLDLTKELIVVKSFVQDDQIFTGLFFCQKNSEHVKTVLKCIENCITNEINEDVILKVAYTCLLSSNGTLILNEHINDNVSYIYNDDINIIFFKHYFNSDVKIFKLPEYAIKLPKEQKTNVKIGITYKLQNTLKGLFTNGINQNTLYLYDLLKNIGYDVILIVDSADINENSIAVLNQIYDTIKYTTFENILNEEFDLIIQLSIAVHSSVPLKITRYLKYTNTKLVGYFCGNTYIIDSEKALYDQHKDKRNSKDAYNYVFPDKTPILDEIWSIPQMVNTNLHYWKTLYRCNCIPVPFIWSNKSIQLACMSLNKTEDAFLYKNKGTIKNIGIFEPNISLMKWCLPCVIICENTYRVNKNMNYVYITNFEKNKPKNNLINETNHSCFENILSTTDLMRDKKLSIEARYNTLDFMSNYCDIAVSHQWENPLNYLYFDLAWMGWPIVHNAHLCKDIGYFYNEFNYEEGGNVLNDVIENHDKNAENYMNENRKKIEKYLPSNIELQKQYLELITNILK